MSAPRMQPGSLVRRAVWTAAVYGALQAAGHLFPGAVATAFTGPAARLGALFLGAGVTALDGGVFRLDHPAMELRVTPDCSGFDFFALAAALVWGVSLCRIGAGASRALPLRLGLVYGVTLLANAARVTAAFHGERWLAGLLPPDMSGAVHLAAGVGTFLPALVLTYAFLERRTSDAGPRATP